ncbi:MAG: hypothetical protein CMP48_20810 [Rickettsiales bacterium]|nr:hypothetical protein [Rickettsiales bacterium]
MRALLFLGALFYAMVAVCQTHSSLSDALTTYSTNTNTRFSFDADLLDQIKDPAIGSLSEDSLIQFIQKEYPLAIQKIESNYYIITLYESTYEINLKDSSSQESIIPDISSILVNGKAIPSKVRNGKLIFDYKPDSKDLVTIYSPGYKNQLITFEYLINHKRLEVLMEPTVIELSTVIIQDFITEGIDLNPSNQSININVKSLPLLPGETDGDLFASLSALPGISTPDNRAGNLYIRGSSTDQSYVMLDNIPIYSRGHYFGTISPYNPKIIDNVEVHRNGFHPRMGGRVGGAIEIQTDGGTNNDVSGGIGANTLFAMGYLRTPIFNQKAGLSLGVRRSFPTSFVSPKLEAITKMVYAGSALVDVNTGEVISDVDVIFEDYQASLNIPMRPKDDLYISTIYTRSKIAYEIIQNNNPTIPEQTTNSNLGISAKWEHQFHDHLKSSTELSLSSYNLQFRANEAINEISNTVRGTYSINTILDMALTEELKLTTNNKNELDFGLEYRQQNVADKYKGASTGNNPDYLRSSDQIATTVSPFVSFSMNQWEKWFLQLGSRLNYYNLINDLSFAPRLFVNWNVSNSFTLKGTTGLYYQYLSQIKGLEFSSGGFDNEVWVLADHVYSEPISGSQSMLGFTWSKKQWVVDLETYYKTANNVTYYTANRLTDNESFVQNDHQIQGFDLFIKKKINESIDAWIGYSYSDFKVFLDTAVYDSKYSQPHSGNIGLSYHQSNFKLSTGWRIASGLNGDSPELAYKRKNFYNGNSNAQDPFIGLDVRYPAVHFWDISASYQIPKTEDRKWSSTIGISLINVYNKENLTDEVVRAGIDASSPIFVDREAIGFAPNIMITLEW